MFTSRRVNQACHQSVRYYLGLRRPIMIQAFIVYFKNQMITDLYAIKKVWFDGECPDETGPSLSLSLSLSTPLRRKHQNKPPVKWC